MKKAAKAFTLLEVLIAMAILATVFIAAIQAQNFSVSTFARSKFFSSAPLLAQGLLSEFEMRRKLTSELVSGTGTEEFNGYTWKIESAEGPLEGTKKLTVRISNPQLSPERDYIVTYYVLEN